MASAGAPGLVSFGLAGGLDPDLAPGTLVLADSVILPEGGVVRTDTAWRERAHARLAPALAVMAAAVVGSDAIVAEPAAKSRLWRETGAVAADMESHGVARAAMRVGRPLLVLRAVADPATARIPPAALHAIAKTGHVRALSVMRDAVLAPAQILDLVRLAWHANAAMASLRRAVGLLGPEFGLG